VWKQKRIKSENNGNLIKWVYILFTLYKAVLHVWCSCQVKEILVENVKKLGLIIDIIWWISAI